MDKFKTNPFALKLKAKNTTDPDSEETVKQVKGWGKYLCH